MDKTLLIATASAELYGLDGEGSPSGSWVLFASENDADATDGLLPPSKG